MPTYTYQCMECGHAFDLFHGIMENGSRGCPLCGQAANRRIGTGAGLIFKGSGFYETDYKRAGASSHSASSTESGSNGSGESKEPASPSVKATDGKKATAADRAA